MRYLEYSKYKDIIGKYYDYSFNFEFLEIVAKYCERCENDKDAYESIMYEEILDYYEQWTIMENYQTPSKANLDEAMDLFACDVKEILEEYAKSKSLR